MNLRPADIRLKGFTLGELMAVIAAMAAVAALAYHNFRTEIKKVRTQEGVTALSALYTAQKTYYIDNGSYAASLASLEISVPTMQNYDTLTVYASSTTSCNGGSNFRILVSADDVNNEYSLYALEDGRIVCNPCTGICRQLGFPTAW